MIPYDYWLPTVFPMKWVDASGETDDDEDTDDPPDPPKCEDCGGRGRIALLTGEVECERCGGSGY